MIVLKSFRKSFVYAFRGIMFVINNERNFRFHIVIMVAVTYFSSYYHLNKIEYAALFITMMSVLVAEIINTAMEIVVNFLSPSYSIFAKIAKDVVAGAVLVSAIFAAIIGFILFFDVGVMIYIIKDITRNLYSVLCGVLALMFSLIFIFKSPKSIYKAISKSKN